MDARLKAKWVKALRSGKYKQSRGTLCRKRLGKYSYCCIGVGALVAGFDPKGIDHPTTHTASRLIGLKLDQQERLVDMNDYEKRSFKTIASYIEKHL